MLTQHLSSSTQSLPLYKTENMSSEYRRPTYLNMTSNGHHQGYGGLPQGCCGLSEGHGGLHLSLSIKHDL